jgi:hypothetical protein
MSEPGGLEDARTPRNVKRDETLLCEDRRPALELTVVEYTSRPDRVTVHPPDSTGVARMETWLSVDSSVVVDLAGWR